MSNLESAGLVLDQGYSIIETCKSMGAGPTALLRWVKQFHSERGGTTPTRIKAMTA
ncbi:transposase [Pseudomonas sp. 5P_3.1_Bac2]|uniref:transposase n=1 Tax=Pseudomonas sp. 5P_3.1_Bac2 TaxID=2971617 RepID=UPI003965B7CB